jgi:glucuronate isomerase
MEYSPNGTAPEAILTERLGGTIPDRAAVIAWRSAMALWLGRQYAARGWVMQLHIGAQRDNNSRMLDRLGPNSGFDSIGDWPYAEPLARFLDTLDRESSLPKTILYGLNPRDNEMLATMAGNFQGGGVAGKVQFGSAWWFNDQQDGIRRHLTSVANMGLLSRFTGMLTDSRSLLSFSRHEYFRRILCDLIGGWVEAGEAPADFDLLGELVRDICTYNTATYFGLDDREAAS